MCVCVGWEGGGEEGCGFGKLIILEHIKRHVGKGKCFP